MTRPPPARRTYSARVMRFRASVYAGRDVLTPGCQVLLLRLSDSMSANAIVSIPRQQLADEFNCAPVRITEWVAQAKDAGYLSVVRRARPKVTAVYQGLTVKAGTLSEQYSEVRETVPLEADSEVRKTEPIPEVRQSVPLTDLQRYARAGTQEGVRQEQSGNVPQSKVRDPGLDTKEPLAQVRQFRRDSA